MRSCGGVTDDERLSAAAKQAIAEDHRDPFDRMLAAQGEIEGLPLVSRDPAFGLFGTRILW